MTPLMQPLAMSDLLRRLPRRHARRLARSRSQGAAVSDAYAVPRTIGERLLARLDYMTLVPARIVEIGAMDPALSAGLKQRYAAADILAFGLLPTAPVSADGAPGWWSRMRSRVVGDADAARQSGVQRLHADPYRLPLADASVDLVVSNLFLSWCDAPDRLLGEVARILRPGGGFLCSAAGPDTLREYRALWASVDAHPHVFGLLDMHDLGDAMLRAGLADPVLDREALTIDYPSVAALEAELQAVGAGNLAKGRRPGLMAPSVRDRLRALAGEGRFACTLEVVQGNAWKSAVEKIHRSSDDEYRVSLAALRNSLKR